ncbi:MAG: VWA domain-containing protein, partial [Anaerolineales bacterium]|nr:VWA domain-containing protein [Anaerolineales bacterium]
DGPTAEQLQQLAEQSGIQWIDNPQQGFWVSRRMLQQMGFAQLPEKLAQLWQTLRDMGLSQETIERISGVVEINQELIREQVAEQVGLEIARRRANRPQELHGPDLMHKSFQALSPQEIAQLRFELQRLVRQIRTRAALRRRRHKTGQIDPRKTMRHSQRYAGVPFEIKYRQRKLKPNIVFIFDASNSMQRVVEFMLFFVAEMQDQVSKMRSFAFYDNLGEVSDIIRTLDMRVPNKAFYEVQRGIPGYLYGTNLGRSLQTFYDKHLQAVDRRTTVIIMGDGRNNHYDPRLDLVRDLQKRAKQLIWFTPEQEQLWGTGDSDMDVYAPLCDAVYPVRNLAQLSTAVDKIISNS